MHFVPISLTRDLGYALRMIASHRWFSAAVIITPGLGIGLNTMVFTLVNAVLFRPLSIPGGERLVAINSQQRSNPENKYQVLNRLLAQLRTLPGVTHAAIVNDPPQMGAMGRDIEIEGRPPVNPKNRPATALLIQLPGYFATINLPLQEGRDFTDGDGAKGKEAAIVSRDFAVKFWPREQAIGKRFRTYSDGKPGPRLPVVGVAANIVQEPEEAAPRPLAYLPERQEGGSWMPLLVRSAGDPSVDDDSGSRDGAGARSGPAAGGSSDAGRRHRTQPLVPGGIRNTVLGFRTHRLADGVGGNLCGDRASHRQADPGNRGANGPGRRPPRCRLARRGAGRRVGRQSPWLRRAPRHRAKLVCCEAKRSANAAR